MPARRQVVVGLVAALVGDLQVPSVRALGAVVAAAAVVAVQVAHRVVS